VLQDDRPGATVADGIVLGYLDDGQTPVIWRPVITSNPHLMIVGLPGMGKTSALINLSEQLINNDINPIIFSYHEDIDEKLLKISSVTPSLLNYEGLGFNPMRVESSDKYAHIENVGTLRDIFGAIFPDLGDVQLGKLRESILKSYTDRGWARGVQGETPPFSAFYEALAQEPRPDKGLNLRLKELADFGFFDADDGQSSLLDINKPIVIQIHQSANDQLQRAFATFMLYRIYQSMFHRGLCEKITHAIIFDEAHRASKLKMIPTMAKECRKYGLSFILASQELRDFNESVFNAIDNYLALRVNAGDARVLARHFGDESQARSYEDRIKALQKYHGYYFGEQVSRPARVRLIQSARDINRWRST
jgi:DNA helicase HerA-like ATPase